MLEPHQNIDVERRISFAFLSIEMILMTWLASGTWMIFFMPMFLCAIFAFAPILISSGKKCSGAKYYKLPIFWFGIGLAFLALAQSMNYSYEFVQMQNYWYLEKLNPMPFLPTSVKAPFEDGNALRSTALILTVVSIVSACYVVFDRKKYAMFALIVFAVNAALMATYAIIQKQLGFPVIYNVLLSGSGHYGTFFLGNAAGAFLSMGLAANLAIFLSLLKGDSRLLGSFSFLAMAAVCAYAVFDCQSIGAIISSSFVIGAFLLIFIYRILRLFLSRKISIAVISIFIATVLISALSMFDLQKLAKTHRQSETEKSMSDSASSRFAIYKYSFEVIGSGSLFGVGGNSYQYIVTPAVVKKQMNAGMSQFEVAKHCHSDYLQYFFEYGYLGSTLIALSILSWFVMIFRRRKILDTSNVMIICGVLACAAHAAIDMHLSIASTMIAFAILSMLAISPLPSERGDYYEI